MYFSSRHRSAWTVSYIQLCLSFQTVPDGQPQHNQEGSACRWVVWHQRVTQVTYVCQQWMTCPSSNAEPLWITLFSRVLTFDLTITSRQGLKLLLTSADLINSVLIMYRHIWCWLYKWIVCNIVYVWHLNIDYSTYSHTLCFISIFSISNVQIAIIQKV